MIEWWQALLIALTSGIAGSLLTAMAAMLVQHSQQEHELATQRQRLEAERQGRRDDAIREARRASLRPVFDLMAELESGYAHRRWKAIIETAEKAGVLDYKGTEVFPGGVPESVSVELAKMMHQVIPEPSVDLPARASVVRSRIDDVGIRDDLLALALGLGKSDLDDRAMLAKVANLHARLEKYAAYVDGGG